MLMPYLSSAIVKRCACCVREGVRETLHYTLCRCKEPLLEACNLLTITRNTQCRTRTQGQMAWNIRAAMGDIEKEAEKVKHALSMKYAFWIPPKQLHIKCVLHVSASDLMPDSCASCLQL